MKKKIFLGIALGFILVIVLVVVTVSFFLGNIVKAGIETAGPKITQTPLTVDNVGISIFSGSAGVKGLVLGNPEGYKSPTAISVGEASVRLAPMSVFSDKVVVKSIEVHAPEITFEGNPLGANNLKKIMDNVNAFAGGGAAPGTNAPAPSKAGKKLEVDKFVVTGAQVHFNGATLTLPDIQLTGLGAGPDGITPASLIKEVMGQITTDTLKAVAGSAADLGKDIGNKATEAGKNAADQAGKIGKDIGGLFKK